MAQFYAYLWLRENRMPYYAGKGAGRRAFRHHECISPPKDRTRILIFLRDSERAAFDTERELIRNWGRLDLGTGCLRNRTDGGDGASGYKMPAERKARIGAFHKGNKYSLGGHPVFTAESIRRRVETRKRLGNYRPKGYTLTEDHKKHIGLSHQGQVHTAETKAKLSAIAKKRPAPSAETRAKMSATRFGHVHSPETIEKIRKTNVATYAAKKRQKET